jgi:hypothetical protein
MALSSPYMCQCRHCVMIWISDHCSCYLGISWGFGCLMWYHVLISKNVLVRVFDVVVLCCVLAWQDVWGSKGGRSTHSIFPSTHFCLDSNHLCVYQYAYPSISKFLYFLLSFHRCISISIQKISHVTYQTLVVRAFFCQRL